MEEREPKAMILKHCYPGIILHLTNVHFTRFHRFTCDKLVHTGKNVQATANVSELVRSTTSGRSNVIDTSGWDHAKAGDTVLSLAKISGQWVSGLQSGPGSPGQNLKCYFKAL